MLSRLYLCKNDSIQEDFVDFRSTVSQHQINGLRFLYRQFKKKKPGVIFNEPSEQEKCLQVVLFLYAMQSLLNDKKPVLILCEEDNIEDWKEHFHEWTDFNDEIAVDSTNPFSKKLIYINKGTDVANFCRRNWGIVVIHNNSFSKDILRATFKADFRIWATSVDLKSNLSKLSVLYQWLYPKEKFIIEDFTPKPGSLRDAINKSILLDAFLEDTMLRRDDFTPSLKTQHNSAVKLASPPKRSRKNKDPTGTKVKKTRKRMIINDNDDDIPVDNTDIQQGTLKITRTVNIEHSNDFSINTNDLFNFIVNDATTHNEVDEEDSINGEKTTESNVPIDNIPDNFYCQSKMDVTQESNTIDFQCAVNDIVDNENTEKSKDVIKNILKEEAIAAADKEAKKKLDNIFTENDEFITADKLTEISEVKQPSAEIKKEIKKADTKKDSLELIENKPVSIVISDQSPSINNTDVLCKKEDSVIQESPKNDVTNKLNVSGESNRSVINTSCSDLDEKISDLQQKMLKKFKGSILDSLF